METLTYDGVYMHQAADGAAGATMRLECVGRLKMAPSGLGWRDDATGRVETLASADIARVVAVPGMRGAQLRVHARDGRRVATFDNVPLADVRDSLGSWVEKAWGVPVEARGASVSGWAVGGLAVEDGSHVVFSSGVPSLPAFDVPMSAVVNATVPAKDELSIELADATSGGNDAVVDMRFVIGGGKSESGDSGEPGESGAQDASAAERLCQRIKEFAQTGVSATVVAALPSDVACAAPRGRFVLEMGAGALRLRGKSYDHRVPYASIVRTFLVPRADETHVLLVLQLDPPLRQGQTRYPFVTLTLGRDDERVRVPVDRAALGQTDAAVEDAYEGAPFEVLAALLRALAGQKIVVPGGSFASATLGGLPAVRCAWKANDGFLYMLERSVLFLPKPVILAAHAEIAHVEASRVGGGAAGNPRSFDVRIVLRRPLPPGGASVPLGGGSQEIALSNIAREEWEPVRAYLAAKGVDVRIAAAEGLGSKRKPANATAAAALSDSDAVANSEDDDESEDDGDYAEGDSDEYGSEGSEGSEESEESEESGDSKESDD